MCTINHTGQFGCCQCGDCIARLDIRQLSGIDLFNCSLIGFNLLGQSSVGTLQSSNLTCKCIMFSLGCKVVGSMTTQSTSIASNAILELTFAICLCDLICTGRYRYFRLIYCISDTIASQISWFILDTRPFDCGCNTGTEFLECLINSVRRTKLGVILNIVHLLVIFLEDNITSLYVGLSQSLTSYIICNLFPLRTSFLRDTAERNFTSQFGCIISSRNVGKICQFLTVKRNGLIGTATIGVLINSETLRQGNGSIDVGYSGSRLTGQIIPRNFRNIGRIKGLTNQFLIIMLRILSSFTGIDLILSLFLTPNGNNCTDSHISQISLSQFHRHIRLGTGYLLERFISANYIQIEILCTV